MSVHITYQSVCDLCGVELKLEQYNLAQGSGGLKDAWPFPTSTTLCRVGFHNVDLCNACLAPIHAAFIQRIKELQGDGQLKGFQAWPAPSK